MADLSLRRKQSLLVRCLGHLILFATKKGYELTLGDGLRKDGKGHREGSLHYTALAQDLNLFIDGEWITDGGDPAWTVLGTYWESLDPLCRWGGRFRSVDSNHFAVTHEGRA
jgi:hypothetical protein